MSDTVCDHCRKKPLPQPKLAIGHSGDRYEQEADRVADQVVRGSVLDPPTRAALSIQRVSEGSAADLATSAAVDRTLSTPGQPLDLSTRTFFESRFHYDFSQVRVHADALAAQSAAAVNARAYTVGTHVVFGSGLSPVSDRRLLAHELTHVVQQRESSTPVLQRAETDTRGKCDGLKDSADAINTLVNDKLASIRAELQRVGQLNGPMMALAAFVELGLPPGGGFMAPIEVRAERSPDIERRAVNKGDSKYRDVPSLSRAGLLMRILSSAINLNGECVGTDKIGHMFQQGFSYWIISSSATLPSGAGNLLGQYGEGAGPSRTLGKGKKVAQAYGEWTEGLLSPEASTPGVKKFLEVDVQRESFLRIAKGHFGLGTTGVFSRGDLAANMAGLEFYTKLEQDPATTFDIRNYVTAAWDEEKSGNVYTSEVGEAVNRAGRLNAKDRILNSCRTKSGAAIAVHSTVPGKTSAIDLGAGTAVEVSDSKIARLQDGTTKTLLRVTVSTGPHAGAIGFIQQDLVERCEPPL